MKYELSDKQATTLLNMIKNGMVRGDEAEEIVELKKALRNEEETAKPPEN